MNLPELLATIDAEESNVPISVPSTWLQGRTAYGGLSASLAHHQAKKTSDNMPPLRSAQIAYVGPLSGEVQVETKLLRRGRNTAFVQSDIVGEQGLGLRCTFIFMASRNSKISYQGKDGMELPPVPASEDVRSGPEKFFTYHMEYPAKRLDLEQTSNRLSNWHRIKERDNLDPMTELLCIGDALPPSAMGLMTEAGPVSSVNWQVNLLTDTPTTDDGWWHLSSDTHHAENGASSQYMTVRNTSGDPVMTGMQSVALFV